LISGVHQDIPDSPVANQPVSILPAPPGAPNVAPATAQPATAGTEADRLRGLYKSAGDAQGHVFGEGGPGSKPPDFTKLGTAPAPAPNAAGRGNPAGAAAPPAGAGRALAPTLPAATGPTSGGRAPAGSPGGGRPALPAATGPASGGRAPASGSPGGSR